jgi:hypothetical protein
MEWESRWLCISVQRVFSVGKVWMVLPRCSPAGETLELIREEPKLRSTLPALKIVGWGWNQDDDFPWSTQEPWNFASLVWKCRIPHRIPLNPLVDHHFPYGMTSPFRMAEIPRDSTRFRLLGALCPSYGWRRGEALKAVEFKGQSHGSWI